MKMRRRKKALSSESSFATENSSIFKFERPWIVYGAQFLSNFSDIVGWFWDSMISIMRHGGWKLDQVAEGYINDCFLYEEANIF